jgi:hypothetical protein
MDSRVIKGFWYIIEGGESSGRRKSRTGTEKETIVYLQNQAEATVEPLVELCIRFGRTRKIKHDYFDFIALEEECK